MGIFNRMNGWQRLWFALTVLSLLVFGLASPVVERGRTRDFSFRWSIAADYLNADCTPYLELPFEKLQQPEYGSDGNCWHIYTTRQLEEDHKAHPTFGAWATQDDRDYWFSVAQHVVFMVTLVLIMSALIYGLGKVIAWIVRGFRPT